MFSIEFFGVASLAVVSINITGFGVIDDMSFQYRNLRHTLFRNLDFRRKPIEVVGGGL